MPRGGGCDSARFGWQKLGWCSNINWKNDRLKSKRAIGSRRISFREPGQRCERCWNRPQCPHGSDDVRFGGRRFRRQIGGKRPR
jgi:hypothetical protein